MQRFLIRRLQLFPCRLQEIATFIESTDSCSIVILNKSPDFRFYFFHGHFHCVQLIKFFFFQRCKETFHAAVVVTFAYITHALDSMHFSKFNFVLQACVLASCIAVKKKSWFWFSKFIWIFYLSKIPEANFKHSLENFKKLTNTSFSKNHYFAEGRA